MLFKLCNYCESKVEYGKDCTCEGKKQSKKQRDKQYNKTSRTNAGVYNNPIWKRLTKQCKGKFEGLDIYQLFVNKKIVYGNLSHHIETVKENENRKCSIVKKFCSRCNRNIILYKEKYCESCKPNVKQYKKERNRAYDKAVRRSGDNIKFDNFYKSGEWIESRDKARRKYKGLCVYDLLVNNVITYVDIVHHVIELKDGAEGWSRRSDLINLITLSLDNHNMIHRLYNKGGRTKKEAQELLFDLIRRWEEQYGY